MTKQQLSDEIFNIFADKKKRLYACENSLLLFSLYYFNQFHHHTMPDFHKMLYKDLKFDGDINKLLIIGFRESAKTSLVKIKIIHSMVYKLKHFIEWVSFDEKKSEANLYDVVFQLQTNERLIDDFGQLFYEEKLEKKFSQKKSIKEFITTNKIKVKAFSTGQSIRGEVYGEYRPDLVVFDDIEVKKTVDSEARTQQVIDFFDEAESGLSGYADLIVLANRISDKGSIAHIEKRMLSDKKAIVRDIPVEKDGKILWSSKYVFTDKEAKEINKHIKEKEKRVISLETKKRDLGHKVYSSEMLNQAKSEEDLLFKKVYKQFISEKDVKIMRTRCFVTIDTAYSPMKKSCNTGVIINRVDINNNWYIKAMAVKISSDQLIDLLFKIHFEEKPEVIYIEETAFEAAIQPMLSFIMKERNQFFKCEGVKHGGRSKKARIAGVEPRYSRGGIFLIENECADLEKEFDTYTEMDNDTKDVLDALAYQEDVAKPPEKEKQKQPVRREQQIKNRYARSNHGTGNTVYRKF